MQTGDGLLVRLLPIGTIALAAFADFCAAARTHGNGVVEITGRGSVQVRGLNAASAPRFADAVAALGIAAADGVPVLSSPLAGLDAAEILDAGALAADLRRALTHGDLAGRLGAKVSVTIDSGGALGLDAIAADVRLRVEATRDGRVLRVAIGGDGGSAVQIGAVAPADGVDAAIRLLEIIAQRGRDARGRAIVAAEGIEPFRTALGTMARSCDLALPNGGKEKSEAIGTHRLRNESFARGIGLAFGHADASSLDRLAETAAKAGASGIRTASRVLIAIGLTQKTAAEFAAGAERLGFIVRADDPRRQVVACAGAPVCASAEIAARAIAPLIAETAAPFIERSVTIHVSGCAKGCAHAGPAALTIVGRADGCALVANGSARDTPYAVVAMSELPNAILEFARRRMRTAGEEKLHA
jgi:precorrin-3B synthase